MILINMKREFHAWYINLCVSLWISKINKSYITDKVIVFFFYNLFLNLNELYAATTTKMCQYNKVNSNSKLSGVHSISEIFSLLMFLFWLIQFQTSFILWWRVRFSSKMLLLLYWNIRIVCQLQVLSPAQGLPGFSLSQFLGHLSGV